MSDAVLSFERLLDRLAERTFDRPPALVSNAHITGLGVARALAQHNVPVIALDRTSEGVASASTAVSLAGRITYPLEDQTQYCEELEQIAAALGHTPVAFGCMDEWVHALAETRPDGVALPFAPEAVGDVLDKTALYARCAALDIPHPETYRIAETDPTGAGPPIRSAAEAAEVLGFPLVLKPARKRAFEAAIGTNVLVVEDEAAYRGAIQAATDAAVRVMAQRQVDTAPGEDRSLASYRSPTATTAIVGNARVRYPTYGTSCVVDRVTDQQLRERGLSVLESASYTGISEAEFVYDRDRETYLLIDVNTRPWKWIGLPVAAGADLPSAAYVDATGVSLTRETAGPNADRWVYLPDYLRHLAEGGRDILSRAEWLALADEQRETVTTGVYDPADPGPAYQLVQTELGDRAYYCAC
jgi:Predicted ATP-grasp enzyme